MHAACKTKHTSITTTGSITTNNNGKSAQYYIVQNDKIQIHKPQWVIPCNHVLCLLGSALNAANVYARHSQTMDTIDCPTGHQPLWQGYSLLHTEDEGRSKVQDLGNMCITVVYINFKVSNSAYHVQWEFVSLMFDVIISLNA